MSESRVPYRTLLPKPREPDMIQVDRQELEIERRHLLGRLQWLNKKLGYASELTGKERRRQAAK